MCFRTWKMMKVLLLIALTAAFNLCACEMGDAVTETVIEEYLGPEGGEVLGPTGTRVIFPPGALESWQFVSLEEVPDIELSGLEGSMRLSTALRVTSETMLLQKSIAVHMPYMPGDFSRSQLESNIGMFRASVLDMEEWMPTGGAIDLDQHLYRGESAEYGVFTLFYNMGNPEDGDEDGEEEISDSQCEDLIGSYCLVDGDSCSSISSIAISQLDGSFSIALKAANNKKLQSFELKECEEGWSTVLTFESEGECLFSFDFENMSFSLDCQDCLQNFTVSSCL